MNYSIGCQKHTQSPCHPRYRRGESDRMNQRNIPQERYDVSATAEFNHRLASVYSPYQEWQNIYNGEKALECGTIFAELDKPFWGYKQNGGICSL